MKPKTNSFPIVTHDSIIIELEESTTLTMTIEVAVKAVISLGLDHTKCPEGELIYDLSPYEFLCSDNFVNNRENQIKVIDYVLKNHLEWN